MRLARVCPFLALSFALSVPAHAQAPRLGKLIVTVVDPSSAVVLGATVTVVALDQAVAAKGSIAPVKTAEKGVANVDGLTPGRYSITAEFPGFELGLLKNIAVRAGDNKHIVVLPLKGLETAVTVNQDRQAAAADPRGSAFGSTLTREQIDALSDDPTEMAQQLQDMVGGQGTFRVDSFEGSQLPPKSQIKSIHITRDTFAAESHSAGFIFFDIITQPGSGPLRANGNGNFLDGSMTGRNPFVPKKGPEQTKSYNLGLSGSLIKNKSGFSVSGGQSFFYTTPVINVALPSGGQSQALLLRTPRESMNLFGQFDYAITRDQTIRIWYSQNASTVRNLGVGAYDLPERAYSSENHSHNFRMQEAGPLGRRFFINTRVDLTWGDSAGHSAVEAPTIRVTDAFTSGGAQVASQRRNRDLRVMSDLDYVRGIHSFRTGLDLWGTWYRSNDKSNYLGTYTFSSLEAFEAGLPTFYTRRIGDPLISYLEAWMAGYFQDDLRLRKNFTLSVGVRYETQNRYRDRTAIGPRIGITWSPFKSGRTSVRTSWGMFSDWMSSSVYEQTLRLDGVRQQELQIVNPSYPDPSASTGVVPPINKYLLDRDARMPRSRRVSLGVDQTITPKLRMNVLYSRTHTTGLLRGINLNAPVNGVRPDASFGTVIEAIDDARWAGQSVNLNLGYNVLAPSPAASRARFNWKRMNFNVFYTVNKAENDTDGAFTVPASGVLSTEWGPAFGDVRHRVSGGFSSTALRNLSVNLNVNASSGRPYNLTTGLDNNGDLVFNDRPEGAGRNSLRYPWQWSVNGSFSYTFTFGPRVGQGAGGGGGIAIPVMIGAGDRPVGLEGRMIAPAGPPPQADGRYRMSIFVRISNLTNHFNYGGFSGVMTSPFFMKATSVNEVRRVNISLNFSF